jgi:hypothetical protein
MTKLKILTLFMIAMTFVQQTLRIFWQKTWEFFRKYGFSSVNDVFSSCLENLQTFQYHKIEKRICAHQSIFRPCTNLEGFLKSCIQCLFKEFMFESKW